VTLPHSRPLDGAHALVTGAGTGIGAAIAVELARRGATVAVTDIDASAAEAVADEIRTAGWRASADALDVTDPASIRRAADRAEEEHGPLTHLVANAGVSSMYRFVDVPLDEWDRNLAVNARGVFLCGQEAARRFIPRGRGVIVNTASMAAKQGAVPFLSHYVASKFAVVGLTQAMAFELAPHGIRVNCVCPGFVATAMQDRELAWEAELRDVTPDDVRKGWVAATPLGRLEEAGDVAVTVAFLCSDDARFVTGEALAVNGGAFMD
jgi:meso-butanediol dehydrogenase/(S,S)-butanediol dehydrogenase/diacetyl reductase